MNRAKKYEIFIDVISKNNLRNKDIVEKTGYSKARISNFKNDAESIPDDFFDIFLKIFDQNNDRSISNYVNEEQAEYQPVVKKNITINPNDMNELERLRETNDFLLNDAKYKMQKILELESELKECKELNRVLHPII